MTGVYPGQERPSLFEDLRDIWSKATFLSMLFTLPTLTLSGTISTLYIEPISKFKEVVFGTWPLVLSALLLAMMLFRGSLRFMNGLDRIWSVGACIVLPYLAAYFFGEAGYRDIRGGMTPDWHLLFLPNHLIMAMANIASYYFSDIGIVRTVSAVAAGTFLAWAYQFKLLPHVRRMG
jgi:hypothetical protein